MNQLAQPKLRKGDIRTSKQIWGAGGMDVVGRRERPWNRAWRQTKCIYRAAAAVCIFLGFKDVATTLLVASMVWYAYSSYMLYHK